jgi:hypothetical protein
MGEVQLELLLQILRYYLLRVEDNIPKKQGSGTGALVMFSGDGKIHASRLRIIAHRFRFPV